jgi:hypothetical protein
MAQRVGGAIRQSDSKRLKAPGMGRRSADVFAGVGIKYASRCKNMQLPKGDVAAEHVGDMLLIDTSSFYTKERQRRTTRHGVNRRRKELQVPRGDFTSERDRQKSRMRRQHVAKQPLHVALGHASQAHVCCELDGMSTWWLAYDR